MSDETGLQFERAEFESTPAHTQCAECTAALSSFYYDVNGLVVCEACRYAIEARLTGGSAAGRAIRAIGAGLVAAALGAALYYGIGALTGYEFGLIAIVVGYAVGAAVRWGSNNRGGWQYQTLAIALTYLAIVVTYIPPLIEGLRQAAVEEAAVADSTGGAATDKTGTGDPNPSAPAASAEAASEPMGAGTALLILLAIACAAPFLAGFENIIGLVIIGIGLYEAWKLNRRFELTITGPHALSRPAQAAV